MPGLAEVLGLLFTLFVGVSAAMLLAPLEALGWWAGWYNDDAHPSVPGGVRALVEDSSAAPRAHYIVFLDGVAKATPENYDDVQDLLDRLSAALPDAAVLGDVLPYAVSGAPLTTSRPLSRFWRYARERKLKDANNPFGFLINVRNIFQVLVSADKRYGPIYHLGEAQTIIQDLLNHGYRPGSGVPITLIGFSGGAQVAAGVTPFLKRLLSAPIDLISLGGVVSADAGLLDVRYLYHLAGSKDPVEKFSTLLFPGRWSWVASSSWNRAKRRGKFTYIPMGPLTHNGPGNYIDEASFLPNGESHLAHTAATILKILEHGDEIRKNRVRRGGVRYVYKGSSAAAQKRAT
ncbi:hypothetical protein BH24DEI2_BH24DEI2_21530 [soil metagenome]